MTMASAISIGTVLGYAMFYGVKAMEIATMGT